MPERKIIVVSPGDAFCTEKVTQLLKAKEDGWTLDPTMYCSGGRGQPLRLENAVFYHLIKYTEEELEEIAKLQMEEHGPRVVSIRKVPHHEADDLLKQGYTLKDTYAKDVVLVKYEEPKTETNKQ